MWGTGPRRINRLIRGDHYNIVLRRVSRPECYISNQFAHAIPHFLVPDITKYLTYNFILMILGIIMTFVLYSVKGGFVSLFCPIYVFYEARHRISELPDGSDHESTSTTYCVMPTQQNEHTGKQQQHSDPGSKEPQRAC